MEEAHDRVWPQPRIGTGGGKGNATRREFLATAAAGLAAAAPAGQLTWGVHISLAPTWFDPAETPRIITPFMIMYALHDAMVKPMPGQPHASSLAESWSASEDDLSYEFVLRKNASFRKWRAGHRRGRQVLVRALPRSGPVSDKGTRRGDRGVRPAACAFQAQETVARFSDVLFERQRRRLDRPQEIRRESRRAYTAPYEDITIKGT